MHSALRVRFLVAMGLPLAACRKEDAVKTEAVDAAAASVAPSASASVFAASTASATASAAASASSAAPAEVDAAAMVHPKQPPSAWEVTYATGGLQPWCRTARAECFPRAHVPHTWGEVDPPPGRRSIQALGSDGCAGAVDVPCGCTPGGSCMGARDPCSAPLVTSVSRQQSATYAGGACCYGLPQHCLPPNAGRALDVRGERFAATIRRSDWAESLRTRAAASDEWAAIAAAEHASIASFARASLELLALGAPAELVEATHRAALDEVRHARIAFALAGGSVGPGLLSSAVEPIAPPTFASFARATFRDACVEETLGALEMRKRATNHRGAVARAIASIADDEKRHAELAWRTLAWAVRAGGEAARHAVREELDAALTKRTEHAVRDVVEPCARALLED